MDVGKQIKKFRQDLKLSQEELASKIFVTRQTISNWENGKNYPDVNSLVMLSQLFNTSLDIVSAVPLFLYLELSGIVLWLLIAGVMIYYAMRLNKQKRNNDIQTYREILAFMEDKENEQ